MCVRVKLHVKLGKTGRAEVMGARVTWEWRCAGLPSRVVLDGHGKRMGSSAYCSQAIAERPWFRLFVWQCLCGVGELLCGWAEKSALCEQMSNIAMGRCT